MISLSQCPKCSSAKDERKNCTICENNAVPISERWGRLMNELKENNL